eukprot:TRINITY_DN4438_c2_g1_i2.p2 TRINITY_DN4438_c2_g1~~TRINITY_DN4438_c2_g1_i2.p2  ORF type:complete len:116 (-),score=18.50 TRINITY_DN4438_c2_g1_i2:121-468(-)
MSITQGLIGGRDGLYTRSHALRLYRHLMRAAEKMPTQNRVDYIKRKTRLQFGEARNVTDPKQLETLFIVGETNLDSVLVQATHLTEVMNIDWEGLYRKRLTKSARQKAIEEDAPF